MTKFIHNLSLLFLLILVVSCTTPIVDLPETKEKLIVQSEFSEESGVRIYFFRGVNMPVNGIQPVVPDSLHVRVLMDGEELPVTRQASNIPFYQVESEDWHPGIELDLYADIPEESSINSIRSATIFPEKDSLISLEAKVLNREEMGDKQRVDLQLAFDITGRNRDRFYELMVMHLEDGIINSPTDTLWTPIGPENQIVQPSDPELPAGVTWLKSRRSYLIDHFKLVDKHLPLNLQLDEVPQNTDLSRFRLVLKSHTEEGFAFIKSFDQFQHDYYAEFPILVSNIDHGIGVFTAYAQSTRELTIKY